MNVNYGNVYINFSTPFSLKEYFKEKDEHIKKNLISVLGNEIIYRYVKSIQTIIYI